MTAIERAAEGYVVDAAVLAQAFALDPATVQELMRSGAMTGHHEKGLGADAGRHRLTFAHAGRTLRIILDSNGAIVSQSMFKTILRPDRTAKRVNTPR